MQNNTVLKRNAYVFSLYMFVALFSFTLTMIGPMVPMLQKEFSMTYSLAGFHQSAYALGMVIMGLSGSVLLKRFGLARSAWGGIAFMLLGLLALVLAKNYLHTLGATFFISLAGTLVMASAQASFSEWQGAARSRIVLESNMMASAFTMLVPIVLLLGDRLGMAWRIVLPAMLVASVISAVIGVPATIKRKYEKKPLEANKETTAHPLGKSFLSAWLIVFFGVSVEWAIGFWCMSYLLSLFRADHSLASIGVIVLGLSAILGRFVASIVSSWLSERRLIILASLAILLGFPLYWLGTNVFTSFLGLAICGFGASNYYPLGLTLAMDRAKGKENQAASLVPVASGSAIGLAPFLLGRMADIISMKTALLYIPFGTIIILLFSFLDYKMVKKTAF